MITILLPIQPNETTEAFIKRVEFDAKHYAAARKHFFKTEPNREKRNLIKDSLTGLALTTMGAYNEYVCFECGQSAEHQVKYCRKCGEEWSFLEVWNIEGEWYRT